MTTSTTPCCSAGATTSRGADPVLHRRPAARRAGRPRRRPRPGSGSRGSRRRRTGSSPLRRGRRAASPDPHAGQREDAAAGRRGARRDRGRTAPSSRAGARARATVAPQRDERGWSAAPPGWSISAAWRRCRRRRPTRAARSRSRGRHPRRSSASAAAAAPRANPPRCPGTSTRRASGGWRSAPLVVVALGRRRRSPGTVTVFDVADTRVLQAIAELRTPWLTRVAEVAGVLATRAGHLRRSGWPTCVRARRLPALAAPVRLARRRPRRGQHRRAAWPARCSGRGPTRSRSSAPGRASRCRRCR